MFTAPDGEPARAAARTVTLNVIGWPSVPALTARLVEVGAFLRTWAAISAAPPWRATWEPTAERTIRLSRMSSANDSPGTKRDRGLSMIFVLRDMGRAVVTGSLARRG